MLSPAGEGGCVASLAGHKARVWCVVATDEHIYSCGADKTIIAWSMPDARRGTSTQLTQLVHHTDVVYALLLAGGDLYSSGADKTIRRYDTTRHVQTLCVAKLPVSSLDAVAGRAAAHVKIRVARCGCGRKCVRRARLFTRAANFGTPAGDCRSAVIDR